MLFSRQSRMHEQDIWCTHSGGRKGCVCGCCLWQIWLRGCLGWQKKGGEWVGCIFGFQLYTEVFPCVPLYKYSSFSVLCISGWNTFIYLHLQFQKIDRSCCEQHNSVSRRINFVRINSEAVFIYRVVKTHGMINYRKIQGGERTGQEVLTWLWMFAS